MVDLIGRLRHRALARLLVSSKRGKDDADLDNAAAARIAALEAQLAEANKRNERLHRRCQIAEGLYDSVVSTLTQWRGTLDRPSPKYDPVRVLFSWALMDMEKAKARSEARLSALEATPPAPKVTEAETAIAAASEYCWQRYKGRDPLNLKSPAVFTSHEHQKIAEYIRARLTAAQEEGR